MMRRTDCESDQLMRAERDKAIARLVDYQRNELPKIYEEQHEAAMSIQMARLGGLGVHSRCGNQ